MKLFSLLLFLVCVSCATRTPVTDKLSQSKTESTQIQNVPVIKQKEHHCGPATLAMVMQYQGKMITAQEAAKGLIHDKLKGSFITEMKARARQEGFMVLEVNDLNKVFTEVKAGHPVIVLQNNGFKFFPKWHFAVLTGMDFQGPDVFLNDGSDKVHEMDMRLFERSFVLGGGRSLVVLSPGKLSATASELDHVEAATMIESLGKIPEANKAWVAILAKWPENPVAVIGAGNTYYLQGMKNDARKVLEKGPETALILYNRAIVQSETGFKKEARESAKKAYKLADKEQKEKFLAGLQDLL